MNSLPKEILNYFATFTETRFNFRRLINYKWTNNELTLDISLFPQFQDQLLENVKSGTLIPISIKSGEYSIKISKERILESLKDKLSQKHNGDFLEKCIKDESSQNGAEEIEKSIQDGLRVFNLELRKEFESVLINLQTEIVEQKKSDCGIESVPPSIFGITNYINQHYEKIKLLSQNFSDSNTYLSRIEKYFDDSIEDILIYDLYFNLQKYQDFSQLGTLYFFFHEIEKESESYPLYFIETEITGGSGEITLSFPRDLVLLNMPAINYFKFESVLTIPRAATFAKAVSHLGAIESFFQNQYGFQNPFILEPAFDKKTHANKEFPVIKCRIGLQTVEKEDKKLLDYSELMTRIELGESSKFGEFIDQYIKGTVPNFQDEVDTVYKEKYHISAPKRYLSDSPIPLNQSQKRILLALANDKNKTIVVDGPPGTGKSHTIAALTYWANEQKKSVVITSHKKEALDVIDRMLTDKFKSLHPQAKPSIVRMDQETGSANNLMNTLSNAVIAAASQRTLDFNDEAIKADEAKINSSLQSSIENRLSQGKDYEASIKELVTLEELEKTLTDQEGFSEALKEVEITGDSNLSSLLELLNQENSQQLQNVSLDEYQFIVDQKDNIPSFLEACERLYSTPNDTENTLNFNITDDFIESIQKIKNEFKTNKQLIGLASKDRNRSLLGSVFNRGLSDKDLDNLLSQIQSLANKQNLENIAQFHKKEARQLTIDDIVVCIDKYQLSQSLSPYSSLVDKYLSLPGNNGKDVSEIYTSMQRYSQFGDLFKPELSSTLVKFFTGYEKVLKIAGVESSNLGTLSRFGVEGSTAQKIWQWIELYEEIAVHSSKSINSPDVENYFRLKQKEVEFQNDQRLKNLNNHLGEMARIKVSFEGGKRFSEEEAKVLLDSVSGIIAEPSTISKYFPMEENLIDILIIDEASQVSIADSISLMLRAKQVVIFGDEYQYGAVSAVNVSSKYSTSYFNEIVTAYSSDYNANISDQAKKELTDEVSKELNDEEQQSDTLLRPQEGTILWLKTFNIRTSTLTFAKAIANYTTSLREHFRSFPEIIGYSNDFFYKPAQMELLTNRIRTKPIGEVLQFIEVKCQGKSGQNVNLDEIEAIGKDIQNRLDAGFKGSIGIITSFKEQQARLEQYLNENFNMPALRRDHKLAIWFVGDVQGEERDIIYYSFVEVKELGIANLASIYPVLGGTADSIRSLKMQRLNVGFSRAKDTMVFVLSQPIEQFSNTRLGDALKFYFQTLEVNKRNDFFVEDESVFDSPMEKKLYSLLLNTKFVKENRDHIKIVPQFNIGKYIAQEYAASIPKYRADFLLTYTNGGKEKVLILEYDGVEYHFKNPSEVDQINFSQEYLDYDVSRQLELESYGYNFLRLNKFNLRPKKADETEADVLNNYLVERLN